MEPSYQDHFQVNLGHILAGTFKTSAMRSTSQLEMSTVIVATPPWAVLKQHYSPHFIRLEEELRGLFKMTVEDLRAAQCIARSPKGSF
ncbi:hypothetical protein TWF481_004864 [Arthrobotrys musiformis]|uniref:Uncharacterized protein n=1 Tax=Arthrobotrys musiformis TaxID=47236 RepID=A0AAV9WLQ7_9PEZI